MKTILQKIGMLMVVLLGSLSVYAYDFEVDGIYYQVLSLSDLSCEVVSGDNKYSGDIIIPAEVNYNNKKFSVISIHEYAFESCRALSSVHMSNSIISIGKYVFSNCSALRDITLSNSLSCISYCAFNDCTSLTEIIIPNSVSNIEPCAFLGCSSLTDIDIKDSIKLIGKSAFAGCTSLVSITIPDSVTSIEERAFANCTSLKSITISNSLISIETELFSDCKSLINITIPNSVTTICDKALYGCSSLITINMGSSITSIGKRAFAKCSSLKELIIPNSVVTLGEEAFFQCFSLKSIKLSESLKTIEKDTFWQCEQLESITFPGNISLISWGSWNNGILFYNCKHLKEMSFLFGETPLEVRYLNINAIDGPLPLKHIYIDRDLEWDSTAGECLNQINKLSLGPNVHKFDGYFYQNNTDLETIQCYSINPPSIKEFTNVQYMSLKVIVPYEAIEAYQKADVWKNFWNIEGFDPNDIGIEMIAMNTQEVELNIGKTVQLEATVLPEDATDKTLEWESSNEEVAIVDETGLVTAIGIGTTTIRVVSKANPEIYAECSVTVEPIAVTSITLDRSEWTGHVGEEFTISATVSPEDATDKTLEWTSSDETVATVDSEGSVNAIGIGTTTIRVASKSTPEIYAECSVTVEPIAVTSITLDRTEWSGHVGEEFTINAMVFPEDATDKTLEWTSSNEEVAIVEESGLVTAIGEGSATITVSCGEASAQCEITVLEENSVEKLFANPNSSISIYSIDGYVIKKNCNAVDLRTLDKGIYIVVSGNNRYKISI